MGLQSSFEVVQSPNAYTSIPLLLPSCFLTAQHAFPHIQYTDKNRKKKKKQSANVGVPPMDNVESTCLCVDTHT